MERRIVSFATLLILIGFGLVAPHSDSPAVSAPAQSKEACTPLPPPPCNDGVSPGVVQIVPENGNQLKLARKRFYLSSCPFNLAAAADVATAPILRTFFTKVGASQQLIAWLETNHCDTIYCRPLTMNEVICEGGDQTKCVPEFTQAFRNALADLKGNAELARKMITNYVPLSDPKLRIGFYNARAEWLKNAIAKIESTVAKDYRVRTTITDKDGIGFFYDLCPGSYYVSSVAPVDIDGHQIVWESLKPIKVDGPPEKNDATKVTLAFAASNKKNTIVGKPISDFATPKPATQ